MHAILMICRANEANWERFILGEILLLFLLLLVWVINIIHPKALVIFHSLCALFVVVLESSITFVVSFLCLMRYHTFVIIKVLRITYEMYTTSCGNASKIDFGPSFVLSPSRSVDRVILSLVIRTSQTHTHIPMHNRTSGAYIH